jgi:hypothetical protein
MRSFKFLGLNSGYEARNANFSNFLGKVLVIVQQALVTQISYQNVGFQATNASYSTLIIIMLVKVQ